MRYHTLRKTMIQTGAALAGISVALGAIGAHLLKDFINEQALETYQTAVRYQFYHAIAILVVSSMLRRLDPKFTRTIYRLFTYGTIIFSGSLYILALRSLIFGNFADTVIYIGGITPIGGILLISGWAFLAVKGYSKSGYGEGTKRAIKNYSDDKENA